ncbi:MAG: arginine--tRNA ligase [Rhodospirillaceae bacterium]|nr:arginine--tRNA ligase [Rhodospirillaceae bacterium]
MNIFKYFAERIDETVRDLEVAEVLPAGLDRSRVTVEPPRDPAHGDVATNAALLLAKPAGMKPRDVAQAIAERLGEDPAVAAAEIAGPGFINLRLSDGFWHACLKDVLAAGIAYGASTMGEGQPVNVEYVSANPTGPLHVGHSRGAVFGDVLARLLEKVGYVVTREYYINDAGNQIEQLAYSAYVRYLEALGETVDEAAFEARFPGKEWAYRGEYLIPVGKALAAEHGPALRDGPAESWMPIVRDVSVAAMMDLIREDLDASGIRHSLFVSEREIVAGGAVDRAIAHLDSLGLLYRGVLEPPKGKAPPEDWEPREQMLFRATDFGDDVDRPLQKGDGSWTYFATDLAYHYDKFTRGFRDMINVWGADHGGYVKRMKAGVSALTEEQANLDVKICQMVNLLDRGEPVRMSKRAGNFVTLRDVVDAVGKDVVRFMMLTRRNDAPLDFDLAKVTEQSRDNPVFYVQYAHARIRSVMRNAEEILGADAVAAALQEAGDLAALTHDAELGLIKLLAAWPRQIESAAESHEPHRLAFYLYDLASAFHGLWNLGKEDPGLRFLIEDDVATTHARLALIEGVRLVIASGLDIFGVEPVEEMR